jgi:glucose/arabinose dehydrogenase/lysophospholipase L1-like esterase
LPEQRTALDELTQAVPESRASRSHPPIIDSTGSLMTRHPVLLLGLALHILVASASAAEQDRGLSLRKGDHISLIGNALAERMQHDGWLEAMIQARLPENELVFRNLGFSGDELTARQRSQSFGSPDEWLKRNQTGVVFAFFGFGESFAGEPGLPKFKKDLEEWIKHTLEQKYDGEHTARLVLFSPIAFENRHDPNLPDGTAHNARFELYTKAMSDVAEARKVPFVDLFHPTLSEYKESKEPFTLDGVHLNSKGNRLVASLIERALFPSEPAPKRDDERLENIRKGVVDKDFYWFERYRTVDGFNVFGGRADLKYTDGISNREVMQREMQVLDAMTSNRDRRVWALAQGKDLTVDDSNTPPFIPVKTNLPGPLEGGAHVFLSGEEAISKMTVAKGMKVNLFASEEQFPELISPVQMAFDTKGRLWVATWPTYPHWKPKDPMNDRLLILEDTDGDGKADKTKTFAGDLHCPTGFEFWNGGVLVAQAPDIWFLKDTDGDDVADVRERVLHGLDSADTHHTSNSFTLGPDGAIYFQEGVFHQSQVESVYGVVRNNNACVWRFDPRTRKVDRYVPYDFANPHGHVFDRWGQDFIHDGTGADPFHAVLFSGFIEFPRKHSKPPTLYDQRTRPCPGTEIVSSRHFPEASQGNLLVGNVIGFQGILQYRLNEKGSSFAATEVEPIVSSSDPKFRPVDLEFGPDGALYFTDWQNPIIGHMQHHIRDPNRNKTHGRVYRITVADSPLLTAARIAGQPIRNLLHLLSEPEDRVRYRARIELSGRKTEEVIAAVNSWVGGIEANLPDYDHLLLEALWVHQQHNVVNPELLRLVLGSKDYRARAAATRVLCYWRDRIPSALEWMKKLAADEHPRVRLEAVRSASFFDKSEAAEIPLLTLERETDKYIDFVRDETLKTLDRLKK